MFLDAHKLDAETLFRADVCIVGAGAAGIPLALQFLHTPLRVCLLESGGLVPDAATQDLYGGTSVGMPVPPLAVTRLRFFGGSTNHWGGVIAPLDDMDFAPRSWVPHSGWPIGRRHLEGHYRNAQAMCDAGPFDYQLGNWTDETHRPFPFVGGRLCHRMWQQSAPARFGAKYRQLLDAAENVQVVLHANVVDIQTTEHGRHVRRLHIKTLSGKMMRCEAAVYVLACGGLENARLLLASRRHSERGVSNDNDLVGRFYSGHPRIDETAAAFLFHPMSRPTVYGAYRTERSPYAINALIGIRERTQREEGLLNTAYRVYFPRRDPAAPGEDGGVRADLAAVFRELMGGRDVPEQGIVLRSRSETVPNPESRVLLDSETDALGMPRIKLDWRLTAQDRASLRRCTRIVAAEFGRAGLGRMRLPEWLTGEEGFPPRGFFGSWHHMGTTRMGRDPATSVVDANGRSHQVDNLYLAGSSVFPTFGWGTPTLTIIALALRLGAHLKQVVRRGPTATGP